MYALYACIICIHCIKTLNILTLKCLTEAMLCTCLSPQTICEQYGAQYIHNAADLCSCLKAVSSRDANMLIRFN